MAKLTQSWENVGIGRKLEAETDIKTKKPGEVQAARA